MDQKHIYKIMRLHKNCSEASKKNEEKWEIPRSLDKNLQKGAAHKEALKNVRSKKWEESKMGRGIRWAWMQNYWMKQPCFDKKKVKYSRIFYGYILMYWNSQRELMEKLLM